ncbi:MAG TPA: hypothetical protein VLL52_21370 [Anaerolineae bacterium]|nr:hypothetical protein [Anaerolineae bacterium]
MGSVVRWGIFCCWFLLVGCGRGGAVPTPPTRLYPTAVPRTSTPQVIQTNFVTPTPTVASPLSTPTPYWVTPMPPGQYGYPTLADFWAGGAEFVLEVVETGLPMGESDTVVMSNGELWSYLHASDRSARAIDQCGDPVEFPGCTVIYRSYDGGYTFVHDNPPVCQFACEACPCEAERDHVTQQQYPRVMFDGEQILLVYEYLGRDTVRDSLDGLNWSKPERVAHSTIWQLWWRDCPEAERIGNHPFVPYFYECLAGGPPGIYLDDAGRQYIFMAVGQNPGGMGCYWRWQGESGGDFRACETHPLFVGAGNYGPLEEKGVGTNEYFDFRTISAAEVQKVGEGAEARYYMLYEGIRGPGPGDPGDTQFGLGLARSVTGEIDGVWEKYEANPILVDLPGNIGLGHADLVVVAGQTILYTSLDGAVRSRLRLVWKRGE